MYKPSEVRAAVGMTTSQFRNARRAAGIQAKNGGSASMYSENEIKKIVNAFMHQKRRRDHQESKVAELRHLLRECGY